MSVFENLKDRAIKAVETEGWKDLDERRKAVEDQARPVREHIVDQMKKVYDETFDAIRAGRVTYESGWTAAAMATGRLRFHLVTLEYATLSQSSEQIKAVSIKMQKQAKEDQQ